MKRKVNVEIRLVVGGNTWWESLCDVVFGVAKLLIFYVVAGVLLLIALCALSAWCRLHP